MNKKITCKISHLSQNTGTGDLDSRIHKGFTIGKGRVLYWMLLWHQSGHVTVFNTKPHSLGGRWISGDSEITIHFKD